MPSQQVVNEAVTLFQEELNRLSKHYEESDRQRAHSAIERALRIQGISDRPDTHRADDIAETILQHIAAAHLQVVRR